jgi:hypothetical protein
MFMYIKGTFSYIDIWKLPKSGVYNIVLNIVNGDLFKDHDGVTGNNIYTYFLL